MTDVVLSLGSNVGERLDHLNHAVQQLQVRGVITGIKVSSVYETEPIGGPEQGAFLNIVCVGSTPLAALELLSEVQSIEKDLGRERHERWGPRVIDIDIVTFGQEVISLEFLQVPHPRAEHRAFVLVPWKELDPRAQVPGIGSIAELGSRVRDQHIARCADVSITVIKGLL